jgi:hypothetical protein
VDKSKHRCFNLYVPDEDGNGILAAIRHAIAEEPGRSMNSYFWHAVREKLEREGRWKPKPRRGGRPGEAGPARKADGYDPGFFAQREDLA